MATNFKSGHFQSICVKDPVIEDNASHIPPIYATSTFTYDDLEAAFAFFRGENNKFTYSRLGNPTSAFVAQKIAELEACGLTDSDDRPLEAKGLLFASGMAAISTALLSQLSAGDILLSQSVIYGATSELMTRELSTFGITILHNPLKDMDEVRKLIRKHPRIRVIYIETPANPTLCCVDLEAVCSLARENGIKTIIDNTFSTPYVQQPLRYGADIVVYSSTKFLNGHGTGISGAAVTASPDTHKTLYRVMKNFGSVCSPFEAYLLNNGIKTLPLRIEQHQKNAQALAEFLYSHPKVGKVNYLGLESHPDHALSRRQMSGATGMLSFELDGGMEAGMQFQNNIRFCTLTASLGTADTLVTHPASTSHAVVPVGHRLAHGITDGLVRSSVGLEHIDDIIADFSQALDHIK